MAHTTTGKGGQAKLRDSRVPFRMVILCVLAALACTSCTFEIVKPPPPHEVALRSVHGQYVTARGEAQGWDLWQDTEVGKCGRFVLRHLANGKVTLKTCYGRYVTAPDHGGAAHSDWILFQETKPGRCGQFDLYELGSGLVALKTCAGNFVTPGDDTWETGAKWAVVGDAGSMKAWEIFTVLQP